jgi:hypothetical protein
VYSSAACLRLPSAAAHSAAAARAAADAVAAIREGSPYTGFHGHICAAALLACGCRLLLLTLLLLVLLLSLHKRPHARW